MQKQIKINPTLFKLKQTKPKQKKTRSNKNITTLLKRIKEHAAKKNQVLGNNNDNKQSTIEEHISYLEKLKQKKKRTRSNRPSEQVNIELSESLKDNSTSLIIPSQNKELISIASNEESTIKESISIEQNKIPINKELNKESTIKPPPQYGILKNTNKPTYREWKRLTQKNIKDKLVDSVNKFKEENKNNYVNEIDKVINKKNKYVYKLGKHKDGKKISVLIKNNKTRKKILEDSKLLEEASITEVKEYLKKQFLYKSGNDAPADVLRATYNAAHFAGKPVINTQKEALLHNFMKL